MQIIEISKMVLKKLSNGLNKNVVVHTLLQNLLDLRLILRLHDRSLLFEQQTHTVKRDYLH